MVNIDVFDLMIRLGSYAGKNYDIDPSFSDKYIKDEFETQAEELLKAVFTREIEKYVNTAWNEWLYRKLSVEADKINKG